MSNETTSSSSTSTSSMTSSLTNLTNTTNNTNTTAVVRDICEFACGPEFITSYCISVTQNEREHVLYHTDMQFKEFIREFHSEIRNEIHLEKREAKGWVRYLCKLAGNILYFYHSNYHPYELDMFDAISIVPTVDAEPKQYIFEIQTRVSSLTLKAPSKAEMSKWIEQLNEAKRIFTNPTTFAENVDVELEMKKSRLTTILTHACQHTSEAVNNFLMLNELKRDKYPQFKTMISDMKASTTRFLHETYGVPLEFTHHRKPMREDPAGMSFLSLACSQGNVEIVEYILSVESSEKLQEMLEQQDVKSGKTPLHYACETGIYKLADMLLSRGATLQLCGRGGTPLHYLAKAAHGPLDEKAFLLIDNFLKNMSQFINSRDVTNGYTPLQYCAVYCNQSIMPMILKNGASFNTTDNTGKTVLHLLAAIGTPKGTALMGMLLDHLLKQATNEIECSHQITLMDLKDNAGQTAIEYARRNPSCFNNMSLLLQHRNKLEEFKFSQLITSLTEYEHSPRVFPNVVDSLSLQINDYHSDIPKLIEKAQRQNTNIRFILAEKQHSQELKDQFGAQFYPVVHNLYIQKNAFLDSILTKKLQLFKSHVDYRGFGIEEKLWKKMQGGIEEAKQKLLTLPTTFEPKQKIECVIAALQDICQCEGKDEELPALSYLMAEISDLQPRVLWHAEADYVSAFDRDGSAMLLTGIVLYFSDTAMHRTKDDLIAVDSVDTIVFSTVQDVSVLCNDIKKEPGAKEQMALLHSIFLLCANNLSGNNEIILPKTSDTLFADYVEKNHFWKQIVARIDFKFTPNIDSWKVKHAKHVEMSSFAKIEASFANLGL